MGDIVAQLPNAILMYKHLQGDFPSDMEYEPGFICAWDNHFFIHTRATLPLYDHTNGIGFGLWVEVSQEDYQKYLQASGDDNLYKDFIAKGTLANDWPGFENMAGIGVTIRTVSSEEKPYITEVDDDRTRDPLFYVALRMQKDDTDTLQMVRELISAYISG